LSLEFLMRPVIAACLCILLLTACTSSKHKQEAKDKPPEFVTGTRESRAPGAPPPGPQIITSLGGFASVPYSYSPAGIAVATAPTLPGLTVKQSQSAKVPAASASVVVTLQQTSGPLPFASLPSRTQDQILAALQPLGIKSEDISFDSSISYGPFPSVSIKTPV